MGFSRQEYWSGLLFPSPGDLSYPEINPASPALWVDSIPTEPSGNKTEVKWHDKILDRHSCLVKIWVWDLVCIRKEDEPVQDIPVWKEAFFLSFFFLNWFLPYRGTCGILVSWPGIEPAPPALRHSLFFFFFGLIISLFLFLFLKKAFCFILEYSRLTVLW